MPSDFFFFSIFFISFPSLCALLRKPQQQLSVQCEGLMPRPNPWQSEASLNDGVLFSVVVPGNRVL